MCGTVRAAGSGRGDQRCRRDRRSPRHLATRQDRRGTGQARLLLGDLTLDDEHGRGVLRRRQRAAVGGVGRPRRASRPRGPSAGPTRPRRRAAPRRWRTPLPSGSACSPRTPRTPLSVSPDHPVTVAPDEVPSSLCRSTGQVVERDRAAFCADPCVQVVVVALDDEVRRTSSRHSRLLPGTTDPFPSSRPCHPARSVRRAHRGSPIGPASRTGCRTEPTAAGAWPWARRRPSRAPGEADVAGGEALLVVVGVVGAVVVEGAQEQAVGEVGLAAFGPGSWAWWASHQAAGMSQPSARQCRSRIARALRWAGENRRRVRPRSRISPVAAEDDGDDPGGAGQPAGLGGGDRLAGGGLGQPRARCGGCRGRG